MSPARSIAVSAVSLAVFAAALPAVASPGEAFGGNAYGSKAHLGSNIHSGKSALVTSCTGKVGAARSNHTSKSKVPQLGTLGSVHTKVWSHREHGGIASLSRATTAGTDLLLSNITGKTIESKAVARHGASGYRLTGRTTLTNVKVFGKSAPLHPKRDQKMTIPQVGSVVFNRQHRSTSMGLRRITVTAMTVRLYDDNSLNLPGGSIQLSRSSALLHQPVHRHASGNAYATSVSSKPGVESGRTSPVFLPCGGTDGAKVYNRTGGVRANGLRSSATRTSGRSTDTARRTRADLTAKVSGLHLMGNTIRASAVKARASAIQTKDGLVRTSTGTKVVGLTINGQKRDGTQPVNTKFAVPGVGTLWVHRVTRTPHGLQVAALELDLTSDQAGYAKGTVIRVAGASAEVKH